MANQSVIYVLPIPHYFSQYGGVGGHVAHTHGVVDGLRRLGYGIDIVAEEEHPTLTSEGLRLHLYPLGSRSLWRRQGWARSLIGGIRKLASVQSSIAFCYVRYSVGFCLWLPRLKKVLGTIPLVVELNSFAAQEKRWMRLLERRALNAGDLIVCVTERIRDLMGERLGAELPQKALVLPNAVDVERLESAEPVQRERDAGKFHIGYAGILKPDYDLETLLEAFTLVARERPNVMLHVYGDGTHRATLEALVEDADKVCFHGSVPFMEIPHIIKSFDLAVYTMAGKNSFGSSTKIFEYMASGRPIVAADTPSVRMVLGDNECGLLYPSGDAEALARATLRMMNDPDMAERLSTAALKEAREKHSWLARLRELEGELRRQGLIDGA
jgi:glycosyltransferase involved in cell wall biosynthesis